MENSSNTWWIYALLSAFLAALTTIFAKIGIENVDANLATAVRTVVIVFMAWGIVLAQGTLSQLATISTRSLIFLAMSGVATGLSWIFYFKALIIAANSAAIKDAPPTNPPSTSGLPKISFALLAFTLPPYKIEIVSAT